MPKTVKYGVVVSDDMDKTIVVAVKTKHPHPKYGKYQSRTVKFKAHDDQEICHLGDEVSIVEAKPYSKTKKWRLQEIIKKAQQEV